MLLPLKDTWQRNALDSKFTHPKDAEPYPGKLGLIADGCQTSVRAASSQLLKRRVSLWQQDHSSRSDTCYKTHSLRSRKKYIGFIQFFNSGDESFSYHFTPLL